MPGSTIFIVLENQICAIVIISFNNCPSLFYKLRMWLFAYSDKHYEYLKEKSKSFRDDLYGFY